MKIVFAVTAALALLGLVITASAVTIDTVAVGDAGNAADTTSYGSVAYTYNIGKYEVTAAQYTEFLNAKAKSDTYRLYNTAMSDPEIGIDGCNIQRSGSLGNYTYSVASDWANRPVNYVSYWDACRFANWLHNGQGDGDTETGAYTLTSTGIVNNTVMRNGTWTWAVASEDEWYKAAYYKGGGTNAGYWLFPTQSNTAPDRNMADASGNNANYFTASYTFPIDSGKYTTVVGEFENSDSAYGTFDQGGNVWEWNDTLISGNTRGLRGGSFGSHDYNLMASFRYGGGPTGEYSFAGFRVSQSVPEPSSIIALAGGIVSLLCVRRRRG